MGKIAQIYASVLEQKKELGDNQVDYVTKITVSEPIEVHVDVDDVRLLMRASRIVNEAASQGMAVENGDGIDEYFAFETEGTVLLIDEENLKTITAIKNNRVDWTKFDDLDTAIANVKLNEKVRRALK